MDAIECGCDYFALIMAFWVDDDIGKAIELAVSQGEDLHQCGTMWMHNSLPLQERPSGEPVLAQLFKEGMVEDGGKNGHILLDVYPWGPVDACEILAEWFEIRHLQLTHCVPGS